MGYYINTNEQDFLLPVEHLHSAYEAMCALNKHDDLKRGGTYSADLDKRESWYSWMASNYPEITNNILDIFEMLGFDIDLDDDGNITGLQYNNKDGAQDIFLAAIAPFVADGSWINWDGEDGDRWRFIYRNGRMKIVPAVVTYPEEIANDVTHVSYSGGECQTINVNERLFGEVVAR